MGKSPRIWSTVIWRTSRGFSNVGDGSTGDGFSACTCARAKTEIRVINKACRVRFNIDVVFITSLPVVADHFKHFERAARILQKPVVTCCRSLTSFLVGVLQHWPRNRPLAIHDLRLRKVVACGHVEWPGRDLQAVHVAFLALDLEAEGVGAVLILDGGPCC